MNNAPEITKRWHGAGEVVLWVFYFFWAVWLFAAFLPPKPEQTPFEAYWGRQLGGHPGSRSTAQPWSPEARDLSERMAAGAVGE